MEHISSTTSQISWRPGPDNNSPIQIFTVQTRTPFSVGWQAVATGNTGVFGNFSNNILLNFNNIVLLF